MKKIWMAAIAVVVAAVAVSLIALPRGEDWSTDSPAAREEFLAAVDAMMKLYHPEARAHLERAVELDPDFLVAKVYLAEQVSRDDRDRAKQLIEEVIAADTSVLGPRERLIVERARANHERRYDDAVRMIDDYLEEHPDDPYFLHVKALRTWITGDFDEAERLNRRLIEIAPNWVIAYNQLGYIAMSQGRFVEAEEYFSKYRFVAPDQANPHDSLGELYIITGRYDEAEETLWRSLGIKPDFWAAYDHLVLARVSRGDLEGAEEILATLRAGGDCPEMWLTRIECMIRLERLASASRWREVIELGEELPGCLEGSMSSRAKAVTHLAATLLGERELAQAVEDRVAKLVAEVQEDRSKGELPDILALQAHLRGVRLALGGDLEGALESFKEADHHLSYMQADSGLSKLCNRLAMVEVLLAAGEDGKAHQLLSKVRSVNPPMADDFEERGLKILGLER
ncbi:MAG TPA: tetratricopeptide repeat protein [Methylomirabilota bacterium]|nr:tetratricopeptide repeat protein [Methylomirabilota bacterium]